MTGKTSKRAKKPKEYLGHSEYISEMKASCACIPHPGEGRDGVGTAESPIVDAMELQ